MLKIYIIDIPSKNKKTYVLDFFIFSSFLILNSISNSQYYEFNP